MRQECSPMEMSNTQRHSIPNTPVKQSLANQQLIRKENTIEADTCFQGEIQARKKGDVCKRNNLIQERSDNRGIALAANDSACRDAAHICYDFYNQGLMQLANAAAAVAEERRLMHVNSSSFASASNNLVECAPSQGISSDSSLARKQPVLPELGHRGLFGAMFSNTENLTTNKKSKGMFSDIENLATKKKSEGMFSYLENFVTKKESEGMFSSIENLVTKKKSEGMFSYIENFVTKKSSKAKKKVTYAKEVALFPRKTQGVVISKPQATSSPAGQSHLDSSIPNRPDLLREVGISVSAPSGTAQAFRSKDRPSLTIEDETEADIEDVLPLSKRKRRATVEDIGKSVDIPTTGGSARTELEWTSAGHLQALPAMQSRTADSRGKLETSDTCKNLEIARQVNKNSVLPANVELSRALPMNELIASLHSDIAWTHTRWMDLIERAEQHEEILQLEKKEKEKYQKLNKEKLERITRLEAEVEKLNQEKKSEKEKSDFELGKANSQIDQHKERIAAMELAVANSNSQCEELNRQVEVLKKENIDLKSQADSHSADLEYWKNLHATLAQSINEAISEFKKSAFFEQKL